MPRHGRIVGIAYGYQTARRAHSPHLSKGGYGMCEVLQQLVGMHDVKGGVRETQLVDVSDQQPEIPRRPAQRPGSGSPPRRQVRNQDRRPSPPTAVGRDRG